MLILGRIWMLILGLKGLNMFFVRRSWKEHPVLCCLWKMMLESGQSWTN